MSLSKQPIKGARDFYPEDMRLRNYMFTVWRSVCESFGYEEYDAPIVEPTELYLQKGNEEIINEQTYSFTDRSGRNLTLRTEMTPSVSRMVAARRQELAYPLRLYAIPQCWRYERMQRGRGREFYQLNVDLFGDASLDAELEMLQVADAILKKFGAKRSMYKISLNSRKLMDSIFRDVLKLDETQASMLGRLIDRMHKMPTPTFTAQAEGIMSPSQREAGGLDKLLSVLRVTDLEELPMEVQAHPSVKELGDLMLRLRNQHITNAVYDPTLMRGFDYYTDIAFEVFDTHPDNNRSMFGGGRYDGLVAMFDVDPVPTIGFGMGDITLKNFLEAHGLLPKLSSTTDIYLITIGDVVQDATYVAKELREMGLKVATDFTDKKPAKKFKNATKHQVRYVLVVGEEEVEKEQYTLKNLETGIEETHGLQRIVSIVQDYRTA